MGNAGSMNQHTDPRGHHMPLKLPMPEPAELEERFALVLNSMNLPPDKARLLRQYDNEKKWELICDQERFQVKNPPHTYIHKLQGYLDPAVTRKKFRRRVQESTQVLRELEISLRTNHIGWVREFLNEENKGLDVLVEYLSFAQYAVTYDGDSSDNSAENSVDKSKPWNRSIEDLHGGNNLSSSVTGNSISRSSRHSTIRSNTLPSRRTLKNSRLVCKKDDVHVCIMCLRAIMNYQYGFNMVMSHPHAVNEIALSLNNKNPRTKALVLELLAAVCLVRGGHEIILSAFDHFKEVCLEDQRFEKLMEHFKNEDNNIDFMVACMQFINIVVHSVEDMNFRVHLQYDFTKLGLDEYLDKLKHTESDKLHVQIQAYLDNVFDVGALLEDAETKNAALERVEELEETMSHLTEKLQDTENEAMAKIVELEKQLMQKNKELESVREVYKDASSQVHTLRRMVKEKDEAIQKQSNLEKKIHELEKQGTIKIQKKADGDIAILTPPPQGNGHLPGSQGVAGVSGEGMVSHGGVANGTTHGMSMPDPPPPPPPILHVYWHDVADMFFLLCCVAVKIKKPIKTKFRLPVFNWVALKPNQINGTVFNEIDDERILEDLNVDEFEEIFKTKAQGPAIDITSSKQKTSQKGPNKISLLDSNRAKNLAITLRKVGKTSEEICRQLHAVIAASVSIKSSQKLKKILEIILALGNYMNSGKRGAVYGFKLQSLDLLLDTKSTDRKMTLLHYIANVVKDKYQQVSLFYNELNYVEKAAAVSLDNVLLDVKELQRGMDLTRRENSMHGHNTLLRDFIQQNENKLKKLQDDAKIAQDAFDEVVKFFGENSKTTPPSVFFPVFVRFVKAYRQAEEDNEHRKRQEQMMREKLIEQEAMMTQEDQKSPSHKNKRQQQELIAELRKKQVKDSRHVYEGKDGAIEDIITDLRNQPYRRADAVRRSIRRRFDDQNLRPINSAEMVM
uniref:Formin-like 2a n=1 Tax=Cyprinus carpio TaxID=7962 RepID=A0A8C2J279_CYPCA